MGSADPVRASYRLRPRRVQPGGLTRRFLRVTSVHCVQRSSIRSPLPLRAPADRAQTLPARIGLLALPGVPALPAGRRAGSPDRRPVDRLVPRPLTGGIEISLTLTHRSAPIPSG